MDAPVPSGSPPGRRDNGLVSADWGALVDLDPRLSEALLDSLASADVAAFVEPAAGHDVWTRAAQLPDRPLHRLWVDPDKADTARAVVAAEVADLSALLAEHEPGATAHGFVQAVPRTAAVRVLPPPRLPDLPSRRERDLLLRGDATAGEGPSASAGAADSAADPPSTVPPATSSRLVPDAPCGTAGDASPADGPRAAIPSPADGQPDEGLPTGRSEVTDGSNDPDGSDDAEGSNDRAGSDDRPGTQDGADGQPGDAPAPSAGAADVPAAADRPAARGADAPPPMDDEEAWRQIVAGFDAEVDAPVPPWPVVEDVDPPRNRLRPSRTSPPEDGPPPRRRRTDPTPALPDWVEPEALEDDGHYVPPPPPPVPRLAPQKLAAALALLAGLLLMFAPRLLLQPRTVGVAMFGVLLTVAGACALVWLMRDAPPTDSGPDDGAVV